LVSGTGFLQVQERLLLWQQQGFPADPPVLLPVSVSVVSEIHQHGCNNFWLFIQFRFQFIQKNK
jgi:hypothetical protein